MTSRAKASLSVFVLVLSALPTLFAEQQEQRAPAGFAVVELFTSEGCSSCPPADEALSKLVREADQQKLPIYALEWHVDYWDYLGWKDRWDSRVATQRQYAYARVLPSSVYTPQVVINGRTVPAYAGDLHELEADARSEANHPAEGTLGLTARQESPTSVRINLSVAGSPADAKVLLVEVEGDLKAKPTAGECGAQPCAFKCREGCADCASRKRGSDDGSPALEPGDDASHHRPIAESFNPAHLRRSRGVTGAEQRK